MSPRMVNTICLYTITEQHVHRSGHDVNQRQPWNIFGVLKFISTIKCSSIFFFDVKSVANPVNICSDSKNI